VGGSAAEPDPALAGPKLDAVMDEANKAYDRGDFEDAKTIAGRLLAKLPTNVRMLRIMVSASCIDGDTAVAQAHYARLPPADQEQMRVRCARYGIAFPDRP
jgi:thioredoxin-like negative regulator of GroEL